MQINPIAYIENDFKEKFGIPRQSGLVNSLGKIVFLPEYSDPEALRGIEGFSHLWLIFDFSACHTEKFSPTVRPPRLGGNKRIGVFASRSPFRPNSLGLSCVKLISIQDGKNGKELIVEGADLLDKTPIYDIKPYLSFADCKTDAVSGYADAVYGENIEVDFPGNLLSIIPKEKQQNLIDCLKQDPRPHYHEDSERVYSMRFADFDVHFKVKDNLLSVIKIDEA